ncbi:hypothetical protein BVI1335_190004 [Burkholderia vietnamiensis]|nr:hypothetical protein BVI1335_190004 [Burkholderia vietnamiensis]
MGGHGGRAVVARGTRGDRSSELGQGAPRRRRDGTVRGGQRQRSMSAEGPVVQRDAARSRPCGARRRASRRSLAAAGGRSFHRGAGIRGIYFRRALVFLTAIVCGFRDIPISRYAILISIFINKAPLDEALFLLAREN